MKIINYLNRIIEFSFYALFLVTPLVFTSATSELFEFPKMWLTFTFALIIGSSWVLKMILQKRIFIKRTPLDIPLILFLVSHVISTIFSLDSHVSLWGYYSRFNGGLLSIISYLLLFYALISNLHLKHVLNILKLSIFSGLIVAAWGLPSHFGYDPTCFIFRGNFDTSCWTDAFKPTIRMFSTLGQPAWLAAFMSILIPVSIAYFLDVTNDRKQETGNKKLLVASYLLLAALFYACLTYTNTRGGFIGFWIANSAFWSILFFKKIFDRKIYLRYFLIFNLAFLGFNFLQGLPIAQVSRFTLPELTKTSSAPSNTTTLTPAAGALGGTDSGKIRLLVWQGAINAWKEHVLFGTGVETFAYAYYQYKPQEHNLTSEWDFLYNKAHNEYLNYLTTTGVFGLGSYLFIIGVFLFHVYKGFLKDYVAKLLKKNKKNNTAIQQFNTIPHDTEKSRNVLLIIGLFSGWVSILVSNFFGFSVVIVNLYFFLIPAFVFILGGVLKPEKAWIFPRNREEETLLSIEKLTMAQGLLLAALIVITSFASFSLINYWRSDRAYATGSSLNKGGAYQEAFPYLIEAASIKPREPVYNDELSLNMGTLAAALSLQKDASTAAEFKEQAVALSDMVVATHPNNIVFWKNRVRLFYTLAQAEPANEKAYYTKAHEAISRAHDLSPNDAKVLYNLAVLEGQLGNTDKAIGYLTETVKLKPNYRDAYFALALFYDQEGEREKAVQILEYIVQNISPQDEQAKETLEEWR
jgi:putative inorganic carbon (hco3(-)) transporter